MIYFYEPQVQCLKGQHLHLRDNTHELLADTLD